MAYNVEAVRALPYNDGTVVSGVLALGTCALEVDTADTAGVVRVGWEVPFPGGDGFEGVDGDLHGDVFGLVGRLLRVSAIQQCGGTIWFRPVLSPSV